jgi:pimeloyl-ACP methyl ester carboxylesterase
VPFIEAVGVGVHYVSHGAATADRTAVLLHGFTTDHRNMTGCFEPVFAGRAGWRRLYLDLPGMGRTVAPPAVASTDDVFAVVRAAVRALVPTGRYAVGGESYGGYLARGLAAADPEAVTGLALICPVVVAGHTARDVPPRQVLVDDPVVATLPADPDFDEIAVVRTEETYGRTLREIAPGVGLADQAAIERIAGHYGGTFPVEPAPFPGPALLVLGRQDFVTGYRDAWPLLEHYPRATFAVLDRAGHNVQIEQPAVFTALAHEWLDRVEEAT